MLISGLTQAQTFDFSCDAEIIETSASILIGLHDDLDDKTVTGVIDSETFIASGTFELPDGYRVVEGGMDSSANNNYPLIAATADSFGTTISWSYTASSTLVFDGTLQGPWGFGIENFIELIPLPTKTGLFFSLGNNLEDITSTEFVNQDTLTATGTITIPAGYQIIAAGVNVIGKSNFTGFLIDVTAEGSQKIVNWTVTVDDTFVFDGVTKTRGFGLNDYVEPIPQVHKNLDLTIAVATASGTVNLSGDTFKSNQPNKELPFTLNIPFGMEISVAGGGDGFIDNGDGVLISVDAYDVGDSTISFTAKLSSDFDWSGYNVENIGYHTSDYDLSNEVTVIPSIDYGIVDDGDGITQIHVTYYLGYVSEYDHGSVTYELAISDGIITIPDFTLPDHAIDGQLELNGDIVLEARTPDGLDGITYYMTNAGKTVIRGHIQLTSDFVQDGLDRAFTINLQDLGTEISGEGG